jgi:hydroxymethylglutaryl-CoA synthase
MTAVGIDAVELWPGKTALDLPGTFAPANDEDPAKYTKGLGLHASSLPDVNEDIVTMGANAAYRLLRRRGLGADDVGRIDVATESAFDRSKPLSTYIAGCLEQEMDGDFHHANKGERKFACIAGTQCLDDACNWIRAGRNRDRAALVVATDTALYERGGPGEATQGAGAVAMLVTEDPDLVRLDAAQGIGSADETDFLKPNQQFPSVDGERSVHVYLARMREALQDFETEAGATRPDQFAYIPFHTPFPGMVRKAAGLGYRHMIRDTDIEDALADEIGTQPRLDGQGEEAFLDELRAYTDALTETDRYRSWYETAIDPTLSLSREVGNWYTGSVHLARTSALCHARRTGQNLTGKRLLVGSYGSGAQAEIHTEEVADDWQSALPEDIDDRLDARYDLSFEEYETIHASNTHGQEVDAAPFTDPDGEFVVDGHGPMGERTYTFVA